MSHRRKSREAALQVLYALDVLERDVGETFTAFWGNFDPQEDARQFALLLIQGSWGKKEEIDTTISQHSENWSLSRMARVDRNILRMAVYELLYCLDIPPKVTINEAIDLAKIYGSENSGSFINGILDALYADMRKMGMDKTKIPLEEITYEADIPS
ncbi:MAG: transcription antitermination factor NusB [Syntrophobacterales bacterium]|jgi:N utilization substance protein B|nr:transcription antitermination factor NusB [Syntrophobacterales bacterium]